MFITFYQVGIDNNMLLSDNVGSSLSTVLYIFTPVYLKNIPFVFFFEQSNFINMYLHLPQ